MIKKIYICLITLFVGLYITDSSANEILSKGSNFDGLYTLIHNFAIKDNGKICLFKIEGKNHVFKYHLPLMDNNKANPWHKFIEDINDDQPVIVLENFKILQLNMQGGKTYIQENGRKIDWQEYIKKLDNVNNLCFMIRYSPFEKVEIYYDDLKLIDTLSRGRYTISRKPEKSKRSTQPH